jgi:ribonuclease P protein component
MLLAKNRLKKKKEIDFVFQTGKMLRDNFLCLKYCSNQNEITRVAFSLGLGYSKSAVQRNRAKRIMREVIRLRMDRIKSGFDLVFFLPKGFKEEIVLKKMESSIEKLLKEAQLFN